MTEDLATGLSVIYDEPTARALATKRFGSDWNTLAQPARVALVILVRQGFNPYTDLMIYEGKPMVLVDGWYNAVRRAGQRITRMITRPIYDEERHLYALKENEIAFLCNVHINGDTEPFASGFGKADPTHPFRKSQVEEAHPARMAEKRAEAQALRKTLRALGVILPTVASEAGDDDSVDSPNVEVIGDQMQFPDEEP